MEFSRPEYWRGQPFPSPRDLPNPGIEPRSPALQADSSPAEPQGKPKNTGVGSLSLLQRIFLTQEPNLHCRRSLYQLSHQGRPEGPVNSKRRPASATMPLPASLCRALPLPAVPLTPGHNPPLQALLGGNRPRSRPSWLLGPPGCHSLNKRRRQTEPDATSRA